MSPAPETEGPRVPVKRGDLLPYARRKCRWCHGTAELVKLNGKDRVRIPCGCAVRRFLENRRGQVDVQPSGQLVWKIGHESAAYALKEQAP